MSANTKQLQRIELIIFDVDGVLTDGWIECSPNGEEHKRFYAPDGAAIKWLQRLGPRPAILTGRESRVVAHRALELGIDLCEQNAKKKLPAYERILAAAGVGPEQTAYVGDDLLDLPCMVASGWSAAPADARPEVRARADYVASAPGGRGAVREIIETILKAQGRWNELVAGYVQAGRDWQAARRGTDTGNAE